ncbi:MAG TPA: response regulator [Verrucomicrobiota bacterium]|nr:response regulator [Verrucomicrobiota bacterium]HNU52513.1 response regulator [Verrucomicrobiota bacterium]
MNSRARTYVAVVDDDESVCRSLARLLLAAGFQPVTYGSAEAFLEDAKRPRFDCLVLDIQLEGMSGLELSGRLAAVRDVTPVVFLTAHDTPQARAEAEALRCAGYFRKTDPGALVLDAITRAIRPRAATQSPVAGGAHHACATSGTPRTPCPRERLPT